MQTDRSAPGPDFGFGTERPPVRIGSPRQRQQNHSVIGRNGLVPLRSPVPAKLAALVDRSGGPLACWPWIGRRDGDGYGRISVGYTTRGAHVLAFEATGRTLAPGQVVRHECDNPPCCNPAHLLPGSKADNNADCRARGRTARGNRNAHAKLTDQQVEDIRREAASGARGIYTRLGAKHGISSRQASYIAKGQRRGSNDPRRAEVRP